ncbi:response regulator transcription factor [Herbaspirillum sp. RTI4]|uniref:response regulator transcription factor n=1 Tax=Herbaspirillum sp. RTI4 TaxID=3048640 RepID=UPI002AB36A6F|nr:response regulator transcription factor [Herbaspirillum sp. RTI4]MDY7577111.1 response regulator transcription factor [Herbaspirillum sp. RTI4]MEA9982853.1 response regulator transcription factor [Herbaspirillum sp. RTI4]
MTMPPDNIPAHPVGHANPPIRVLIADDHQVVLLGISKSLEKHGDIDVVATVQMVSELMAALEASTYNVLLCDYSFCGSDQPDGLPMLQRIRKHYPDMKIILLTSHDDMTVVEHVMKLGVTGFLSKRSGDFSELPNIVRKAMQGERYIDPQTSQAMSAHFRASSTEKAGDGGNTGLSLHELEIVRFFTGGMTLSEIAQMTQHSLKTVIAGKQSAMQKLGARSDIELLSSFKLLTQNQH